MTVVCCDLTAPEGGSMVLPWIYSNNVVERIDKVYLDF